ncbi:hypothetical protein M0805_005390 [Coniferiporia weirii]|nr:hypothetical protein M0805_005390 [Coniferiporia weirii]
MNTQIRGLKAALNANGRYKYKTPEYVVNHLVVGGGVVGLAIARALALRYPDKTTYLVERNKLVGEETSSRNSEVIHAGIYYPSNSLKEHLCIRGRHLLYRYCDASSVPYRKIGKLVVAHEHQKAYVESLKALNLDWPSLKNQEESLHTGPPVPTRLISGAEARELEPDLSADISVALLSPETGIIDSHSFMSSLERDILESDNTEIAYSTSVVRVDPFSHSGRAASISSAEMKHEGWVVQTVTRRSDGTNGDDGDSLLAHTLINASGLSGNLILNSLLPRGARIPMYYARGSYAAYNGPGVGRVSRLLYPCPDVGTTGSHAFQSLGTHLTFDLSGNVRFGPGIQWISPAHVSASAAEPTSVHGLETETDNLENEEFFSYEERDVDFWKRHLVADETHFVEMYNAVRAYLPGVEATNFRPDYVGIRPKLIPAWGGFQDFVFRRDRSINSSTALGEGSSEGGLMISLMGLESPGLTASLAIAEKVVHMLDVEPAQREMTGTKKI